MFEADNMLDILNYTVAMMALYYDDSEIDEYISEFISVDNYTAIQISKDRLDECRQISASDDGGFSIEWQPSDEYDTGDMACICDGVYSEDRYEGFSNEGGRIDIQDLENYGYHII